MIPDSIFHLPKLEKLDLRWNQIQDKTAEMRDLEERGCLVYI